MAIQLAAKAQLWVAPTASGPTSSFASMKGTGPKPTAKEATKRSVAMAASTLTLSPIPMASKMELLPIPAILRRIQVLRPILSDKGAQRVVMIRFNADTAIVSRAAFVGNSEDSKLTEYMTILLIPVSCCATMTETTAMMAGR